MNHRLQLPPSIHLSSNRHGTWTEQSRAEQSIAERKTETGRERERDRRERVRERDRKKEK